ncbi:class I SAM-dependent methyltransferase [Janibacter massiliensis]|uniref:class I SAM-dependent methyltransferase n=1 Tax=Janibacter massiliensis TaxID=2058291 RepID=UPI000D0FC0F9|nr:class I SAM-dependent methyltransferase [Janibacter massiliensis]
MDISAFLDASDDLFTGDPGRTGPRDPAHAALCERVAGMTTANEVAVLNLAASLLPEGECYLEVGTFRGRSICGAVRGVDGGRYYAMENFVEFGMLGQEARAELLRNLDEHTGHADVTLLEGDAFTLLTRPGVVDRPIGVYFYDGEHTTLSHYVALGVIEPLLADEALVLVDDATWPVVERAHRAYLARHPGWSVVRRWDARTNDDPLWANGLHALRWVRPAGARRGLAPDVRAALTLQRRVVGPARGLVWRAGHRFPAVVPLLKRINPTGGTSVRSDDEA